MKGRPHFVLRILLLAVLMAGLLVGPRPALGQESLAELKRRMARIQEELDATTRRIEELRTREDNLRVRIEQVDVRIKDLEKRQKGLRRKVIAAARQIYKAGSEDVLELLLTSTDFAELASRAYTLNQVAADKTRVFVDYDRTQAELVALRAELMADSEELNETRLALSQESEELQRMFEEVEDDYEALREKLAAAAARAAREERQQEATVAASVPRSPSVESAAVTPQPAINADGLTCPVAGPNSFIDSWGFPRSGGRTHEGTDIMAAFGTPVVAITNGTITYEGYGTSAGNWLTLSGADGNSYWYMHNQENLVSGGSVSVGQQIATVGNTGNASGGPPHVHFEYHPGGGGPVNPYPLLVEIC